MYQNMEKWEKNHIFWEISRGGTGTKQSGTGTISVLSFYFGPVLVFWPSLRHFSSELSDSSGWLN